MKRLATLLALSMAVFLTGCGASRQVTQATTPPTTQTPQNSTNTIAGNWQFSAVSSVSGKPTLAIGGNVVQAGNAVTTELHVNGSSCFDQMAIMGLTGTVTNGMTTLTSAPLNGQVVTFTGNLTTTGFTGSYSITGGCDAGDQGSVTGINVSLADADSWDGIFTSSAQKTFSVTGNFAQGTSASPEGSVGITGTATFNTPCFNTQTINAGSFPTGSFVLGTLVSLEIDTNNGTLDFVGVVDPSTGFISGTYSVSGGTCDQTGTAAVALTGQWDY